VYQVLKLPPPGTWNDLARPELAGWVAMANPLSSSSAAVSYSMVLQRHMADQEDLLLPTRPDLKALSGPDRMKNPEYKAAVAKGWRNGMGTLTLIAANARYFTDSGTQPPSDVASGDAAAGIGCGPTSQPLIVGALGHAISPQGRARKCRGTVTK